MPRFIQDPVHRAPGEVAEPLWAAEMDAEFERQVLVQRRQPQVGRCLLASRSAGPTRRPRPTLRAAHPFSSWLSMGNLRPSCFSTEPEPRPWHWREGRPRLRSSPLGDESGPFPAKATLSNVAASCRPEVSSQLLSVMVSYCIPSQRSHDQAVIPSDANAGAHSSASPSSNSASARRVKQACNSVRNAPSRASADSQVEHSRAHPGDLAGMPAPSKPHLPARVFGAIHRHALGDRDPVRLAHATAHRLPRAREPDGAGNQALRSAVAIPTTTTRSGVEVMDGADLSHPEGLLGGLRGTTR